MAHQQKKARISCPSPDPSVIYITSNGDAQPSSKRKASTSATRSPELYVPPPASSTASTVLIPKGPKQPSTQAQLRAMENDIYTLTQSYNQLLFNDTSRNSDVSSLLVFLQKQEERNEKYENKIKELEQSKKESKREINQLRGIVENLQKKAKLVTHKPYTCPETGCENGFWERKDLDEHTGLTHGFALQQGRQGRPMWTCIGLNCGLRFDSKESFENHQPCRGTKPKATATYSRRQ